MPTYTLFQNGRHFSILLFSCKLAPVAWFLDSNSKEYFPLNEATRANLQIRVKANNHVELFGKYKSFFIGIETWTVRLIRIT